jgi:hypothetical protein
VKGSYLEMPLYWLKVEGDVVLVVFAEGPRLHGHGCFVALTVLWLSSSSVIIVPSEKTHLYHTLLVWAGLLVAAFTFDLIYIGISTFSTLFLRTLDPVKFGGKRASRQIS